MNEFFEKVIQIAKDAGDAFRDNRDFEIEEKGDIANIVTSMDVKTQNYCIEKLLELMPESSVYAEEEGVREMTDGYVWVIDPIDGTTNYAYDAKRSCISIGLLYKKEAYFGVVYNPYLKETFYALKGEGAYVDGKRIHVTNNPIQASICTIGTSPYYKHLADDTFDMMKKIFINARDIRRTGSAALELCELAAGRTDCFYERLLSPWDYAAGAIVVTEAGGIIETLDPYTWNFETAIPIVAGNENNFKDFKELIK